MSGTEPARWVAALGTGGWQPGDVPEGLAPAVAAPAAEVARRELGPVTARWATECAYAITKRVWPSLSEFHDGEGTSFAEACASSEAQVITFLRTARRGAVRDARLPEESAAYVRALVERGVSLPPLLRGYRLSHALWADILLDELAGALNADERAAGLRDASTVLNAVSDEMVDVYEKARARRQHSASARIAATVRSVLNEDPDAPRAGSAGLGYDLTGAHVGFVLGVADPTLADVSDLDRAAAALVGAFGGSPSLSVAARSDEVWVWAGPGATATAGNLGALLPPGVGLGCGGASPGADGFRRTHSEARDAWRITLLRVGRPPIAQYEEVAHLALLTRDEPAARRIIEQQLGTLAREDPALVATLRAWFVAGGSMGAAAFELGVHRNTVRERLLRVEALLGGPVGDRGLALRIACELDALLER